MNHIAVTNRTRPEAVIADEHVAVEPGQFAQTTMTVRNTGTEIAEYSVSMVPDSVPGPWMDAVPGTFRLMPGREQEVILRFQPPLDSSTDAGTFPYGVLIAPDEVEHQAQIVVEGDVSVGAIHALEVKIAPRLSKGRWRGKHLITLHNRGTEDTRVKLQAIDEDDALSLALAPASLTVPARTTVEAYMRVRPRSPQVMGKPVEHPFQVAYRRRVDSRAASTASLPSGGEIEASVSGSFRHKPIVSPLLIVLGLLLIGIIVLLLVLRPWETEEPRRPPEPPAGLTAFTEGESVVLAWENGPNVDEILVRQVDCETAAHVIPTAAGEETSVIPSGSGRQTSPSGPFELGSIQCFQARAVSSNGPSVWSPSPALRVEVGSSVNAPEVSASHDGGCILAVDFEPVEIEGALYEVWINNKQADPEPVSGGGRYPDQEPGQTVEVFVQTVVGEQKSAPSNTVEVPIPTDCASSEGGTGGGGGGGGTETTEQPAVVDLRGKIFLLMTPVDTTDSHVSTWQGIGGDVGLDPFDVRDGVVGESVVLPSRPAEALDGRRIIYVALYDDQDRDGLDDEVEAARADCADLNRRVEEVGDTTLQVCRLVHANGAAENVAPAQDPAAGEGGN